MRAHKAFLHVRDGVGCPAQRVDLGKCRAGFVFQFLGLAVDDMAAVENVLELQQVGLVG